MEAGRARLHPMPRYMFEKSRWAFALRASVTMFFVVRL